MSTLSNEIWLYLFEIARTEAKKKITKQRKEIEELKAKCHFCERSRIWFCNNCRDPLCFTCHGGLLSCSLCHEGYCQGCVKTTARGYTCCGCMSENNLEFLVAAGCSPEKAKEALKQCNNKLSAALEWLSEHHELLAKISSK